MTSSARANAAEMTPQDMELAGRNAYIEHIDSSGIHSNRFPSWGELVASEREAWISKALNRRESL